MAPFAGDGKGLLWKLPTLTTKDLGKLGPGFGVGAGCGVGFGIGLFGGAGVGAGLPGLRIGFGVGAGCGVGVGFGYGVGRGVGYDGEMKRSNVGELSLPSRNQVTELVDDIAVFTEKQIVNARKQIEDKSRELKKKVQSWKRQHKQENGSLWFARIS